MQASLNLNYDQLKSYFNGLCTKVQSFGNNYLDNTHLFKHIIKDH